MVAGRLPWEDGADGLMVLQKKMTGEIPAPTDFYPEIPGAVVSAVLGALATDREARTSGAAALRAALTADVAAGAVELDGAKPTPDTAAAAEVDPDPRPEPEGPPETVVASGALQAPVAEDDDATDDLAVEVVPPIAPRSSGRLAAVAAVLLFGVLAGGAALYFLAGSGSDRDRGSERSSRGDRDEWRSDRDESSDEGDEETSAEAEAGEGAKAKDEEGKVGKKQAKIKKAKGAKVAVEKRQLDEEYAESTGLLADLEAMSDNSIFGPEGLDAATANATGGLIGSQYGDQYGSGGLGSRGGGFGGGGSAQGLGGLGTRGRGTGSA